MTQDDVIRMAREAGLCTTSNGFVDWVDAGPCLHEMTAFAKLVAAHERQAIEQAQKPEGHQEPVAHDKTELNRFAQDLYDQKMREGKHGHYELMFHVIHQCIKRVAPPQRQWVGLTEKEQDAIFKTFSRSEAHKLNFLNRIASAVEAKLKDKNGYAEEKNT